MDIRFLGKTELKQTSILYQNEVTEKQKLTMIELFSGIGAQKEGTDLTGVFDCEVVATADIEKDAMVSYAAIHDGLTNELIDSYGNYPSDEEMRSELIEKNIGFDFKKMTNPIARMKGRNLKKYYLAMVMSKNLGDISKISELPLADFWTYSSPCQDWSVAGKQQGGNWTCLSCGCKYNPMHIDVIHRYICPKCGSENIKSTRSGLLFEVERLLVKAKEENTLPQYLLLENVKNLVGKQFKEYFDDWIARLDELGFNTYWSVVNAKDCGIAQNRERVFAVSIRKDIDTKQFEFMKPFDLGLRLRDFLDDEVDEKYYLSQEIQDRPQITDPTFEKSIVGTTKPDFRTIGQRDLVYQKDGIMGTLVATDYKQPKQILEDSGELVRKLTPKECWRLMGFTDDDYDKAVSVGLSDSAGYKQAGNSIVTNCIELIMEHLYKAQYDNTYVCFDENFTKPQVD